MAGQTIPHFKNDDGVSTIEIGVREFQCMGATPPQDHPHVYLDMGKADEIVCPYCSTLYKFNDKLAPGKTVPDGCLHKQPILPPLASGHEQPRRFSGASSLWIKSIGGVLACREPAARERTS